MMPTYALIINTTVQNIIIASSVVTAESMLTGCTAIDIGTQRVSPGDTYNGSVFSPGPGTSPSFPIEIFQNLFGGKVTPAELTTLGLTIQTDQQLRVIWDLFAGWRMNTSDFLDVLVLKGIMTPARRDQFKV